MSANYAKTKVITGVNSRLSYFHGWEPFSFGEEPGKYSVCVLIPKDDEETVRAINIAIDAAIEEGVGKFGGKKPQRCTLRLPVHDGDLERDDPAYAGHWFINASSRKAPQIVDQEVRPIEDQSEVYSGCYARVSLRFYAYSYDGCKGIACALGNIQKTRDGESFGGAGSAVSEFTSLRRDDDEDEDFPF